MRTRVWIVYLAVLLGATAGYVFIKNGSWLQIGWQVAIGWTAAARRVIRVSFIDMDPFPLRLTSSTIGPDARWCASSTA